MRQVLTSSQDITSSNRLCLFLNIEPYIAVTYVKQPVYNQYVIPYGSVSVYSPLLQHLDTVYGIPLPR